jgi:hypothetical protein
MTVAMSEVAQHCAINITLTGVKTFSIRMGIALVVLRLASWISPLPFVIGHGQTDLPD